MDKDWLQQLKPGDRVWLAFDFGGLSATVTDRGRHYIYAETRSGWERTIDQYGRILSKEGRPIGKVYRSRDELED